MLPFAFTSPPPLVKPVGIHSVCPTDLKLAEETRDPAGAPLHKGLLPGEHTKNLVARGRGKTASCPRISQRGLFPETCPEEASPVLCFLTIICLNNSSIVLCRKRYSPGRTFLHPLGKKKEKKKKPDVLPLP